MLGGGSARRFWTCQQVASYSIPHSFFTSEYVRHQGHEHLAVSALLDLLFPSDCVVCERPPQLVCPQCLPEATESREVLQGYKLHCALELGASEERLITGYKDQMKLALAGTLAHYLDASLDSFGTMPTHLAFPPSSRENFARRGYNPVELICTRSKRLKQLPTVTIRAKRELKEQRGLSARDRLSNTLDAFEAAPGIGSVLIVDDVVTTGATVLALAAAIELAGYQVAGICAIARRN